MKKILAIIIAAFAVLFTGCDKTPTVEAMETTATAVGKAAALAANQTKIDDKSRAVVVEIMTTVTDVVPSAGQSFTDAWTPVAKEVIDKLVAEKKIDEGQAILINGAFGVATRGLDYIFTVKYPKAKQYNELVTAAVRGFTGGFLSVFKSSGNTKAAPQLDYDKDAYDYLVSQGKSGK